MRLKKLKNSLLSLMIIGTVTLVPTTVFASTNLHNTVISEVLVDTPQTRDNRPPSSSSPVDLTQNDYVATVEEMRISVYTNKVFKGSKNIMVQIDSVNYDKNGFPGTLKGVFVQLYQASIFGDTKVGTAKEISLSGGNVKFTELDIDKKYFIEFYKQSDSSIYWFEATVTD